MNAGRMGSRSEAAPAEDQGPLWRPQQAAAQGPGCRPSAAAAAAAAAAGEAPAPPQTPAAAQHAPAAERSRSGGGRREAGPPHQQQRQGGARGGRVGGGRGRQAQSAARAATDPIWRQQGLAAPSHGAGGGRGR